MTRGPDLAHLERQLGDLVVESEVARTSRAVIYRIRCGPERGQARALKLALAPGTAEDLAPHFEACGVPSEVTRLPGIAEVLDAASNHYPRDTGRWGIDRVF